MDPPNFLKLLSPDTRSIIQQMIQPSKIYLVNYHNSISNKRTAQAAYITLDDALEFILSLVSTSTCVDNIANKYHRETKTWTYSKNTPHTNPYYYQYNLFDIEEFLLPGKITRTYSIDHNSKKLCVGYEELKEQPESLLNFDTARMNVY
jgi:hypothetical protein